MAKKPTPFLKKHQKQLLKFAWPAALVLTGLIIGYMGNSLLQVRRQPRNLVWPTDQRVALPADLRSFLQKQNGCKNYRGSGTETGVGLWGVYQVEKGQFAKIAYGCSWTLSSYIMAVKQKGKWTLIPPAEYFAATDAAASPGSSNLPKCVQLTKYKINKVIEPFCIDDANQAQVNSIP